MPPLNCCECGHDLSISNGICPDCRASAGVENSNRYFPFWTFLPIGILVVILVMLAFVLVKRNQEMAADQTAALDADASPEIVTTRTSEPVAIKTVPISVPVSPPSSASTAARKKGEVALVAKVSSRNGSARVVRHEKFYLLDREVEAILSAAGISPIDGHSLKDSLGMSIVFPDRYHEFNQAALNAIRQHIKYSGKTDGFGEAKLNGIEPDGYFLFGMTRSGQSFTVWNSPVSVQVGENILNLAPQTLTEIQDPAG